MPTPPPLPTTAHPSTLHPPPPPSNISSKPETESNIPKLDPILNSTSGSTSPFCPFGPRLNYHTAHQRYMAAVAAAAAAAAAVSVPHIGKQGGR